MGFMCSLAMLLLIGLLVWFWLESLNCRDIAIQIARGSCRQQDLQLLDGTVSLRRFRPYFKNRDDFGLKRTYIFDYSGDGFSRQTGCVVLQNRRIISVVLESDQYSSEAFMNTRKNGNPPSV
jgi:hypothetical protein